MRNSFLTLLHVKAPLLNLQTYRKTTMKHTFRYAKYVDLRSSLLIYLYKFWLVQFNVKAMEKCILKIEKTYL